MNATQKLSSRGIYERMITEEDVVREIQTYFGFRGIILARITERIPKRTHWGKVCGKTSTPGIPDLIGYIRPDRLKMRYKSKVDESATECIKTIMTPLPVYIEVKRPGGKHRLSQEAFIAQLKEDKVIAFFAESVEQCIDELEAAGVVMRERVPEVKP